MNSQAGVSAFREFIDRILLMPEMPYPREDHRHPVGVGRRDGFRIAHRAARLDDGRDPGLRRFLD